jgi:hypothetical protein
MDDRAFDRLTRHVGARGSRRAALLAALAVVGSALLPTASGAKPGKETRSQRRRAANRRQRRMSAQALPAGCCNPGDCAPGPKKDLPRCCYQGADLAGANLKKSNLAGARLMGANLTGANLDGTNLGGACLVGADLTGTRLGKANLRNAIFCGTKMPGGSFNNDDCDKPTACCSTCGGPCPADEKTGRLGFCCPQGHCSCGGGCCDGPDCWIFTDFEVFPFIIEELCEEPCIGIGCPPIGGTTGGSIRRR